MPADNQRLKTVFQFQNAQDLIDGADAEGTGGDKDGKYVFLKAQFLFELLPVGGARELFIDRDPGDVDLLLGNTQLPELELRPFTGNGVKVRFGTKPYPVHVKIRHHSDQF